MPGRIVTVQKCTRVGGKDSDIENIGRTSRHHSFFEMLGNFSFGDYYKQDIIPWSWEFVTQELGLEPERLSVTVFGGDDRVPFDEESLRIWNETVGVPKERIFRMPKKDNFWGPPGPTGPCGPCTEIFYDRGSQYCCSDDSSKCGIGKCDCDRYLEFWNLVFMELSQDETGKLTPLTRKNVDTGAGLERLSMILQEKDNTFETDLLFPILQEVVRVSGVPYRSGEPLQDQYLKIVADHVRSVTFLLADGVKIGNRDRDYVPRFLIRRGQRFGKLLGLSRPFLHTLIPTVVDIYGEHYPELRDKMTEIIELVKQEELRFLKQLNKGLKVLDKLLKEDLAEIPGHVVFDLHSTYGFPVELTREIVQEAWKNHRPRWFHPVQGTPPATVRKR